MRFERFTLRPNGKTVAFARFRQHHTELNDLYWAYAPAAHYAIRHMKTSAQPPAAAFHFTRDPRRASATVQEWNKKFKDFDNWVRLSSLMSLAAYFEIYLRSAVSLALESDPGVLLGKPRVVDGVVLLKTRKDYSYSETAVDCVKGSWQERLGAYGRLFEVVPAGLEARIGELEEIRKLRNAVGHMFGRAGDFDVIRNSPSNPASERLSEARLQKFLGVIMDAALEIDTHLGAKHIGHYETLLYYHFWRDPNFLDTPQEARQFSNEFGSAVSSLTTGAPGKNYFRELIEYYKRA